jgi:hypothetical protein
VTQRAGGAARRRPSVVTIPIAELIEDLSIYPRTQVSDVNVTNLVGALEAGYELPPLIVDRKTKRIVDGFHRRRAHLKVFGVDTSIVAELRTYSDDADLLKEAVALNTSHGLNLAEIEKRRVVLRLSELGVDDNEIAVALHVQPDRVTKIRVRVATVLNDDGAAIRLEPLKRPMFHFQGGVMSEEQAKAAKSAPGVSYSLLAKQLGDGLQHHLIDGNDGRTLAALKLLRRQLDNYLGS